MPSSRTESRGGPEGESIGDARDRGCRSLIEGIRRLADEGKTAPELDHMPNTDPQTSVPEILKEGQESQIEWQEDVNSGK